MPKTRSSVKIKPGETKVSLDTLAIRVALTIAALTFLLALFASATEVARDAGLTEVSAPGTTATAVKADKKPAAVGAAEAPREKPATPCLNFLPDSMKNFHTNSRHAVPGKDQDFTAEALYQPDNEDLQTKTPLNIYMKVTYHRSEAEAVADVENKRNQEYPREPSMGVIDGHQAYYGWGDDKGSAFAGWTVGKYSVWVDSRFTAQLPYRVGNLLADQRDLAVQGMITYQKRYMKK